MFPGRKEELGIQYYSSPTFQCYAVFFVHLLNVSHRVKLLRARSKDVCTLIIATNLFIVACQLKFWKVFLERIS